MFVNLLREPIKYKAASYFLFLPLVFPLHISQEALSMCNTMWLANSKNTHKLTTVVHISSWVLFTGIVHTVHEQWMLPLGDECWLPLVCIQVLCRISFSVLCIVTFHEIQFWFWGFFEIIIALDQYHYYDHCRSFGRVIRYCCGMDYIL